VLLFILIKVAAILICSGSMSVGVYYFNVLCGAYSAYLRF